MSKRDSLEIPPAAHRDAKSFEILRVWIANDDQHVVLQTQVWDDPAAWGILLADLARHIAYAYHRDEGLDVEMVLERILAGLKVEIENLSDTENFHEK